jgi:polyhydroxyalkanoate synthesis regulator phasin
MAAEGDGSMSDEGQGGGRRLPSIGEGLRSGIGVLTAFKEAIEETIQEAGSRGDLSPERAKHFLGDALHRAQETVGDVRDRLDFVPRREFEAVLREVEELQRRVDALEGKQRTGADFTPLSLPSSGSGLLSTQPPAPEGPTEARMP